MKCPYAPGDFETGGGGGSTQASLHGEAPP